MAQKFYAVKKGRQTGLFTSWDACKAQVQGYSGAVYKSVTTLQEAQAYLWGQPEALQFQGAAEEPADFESSLDDLFDDEPRPKKAEKKSVKLPSKEVLMLQKNLKLSIRKCLRTLISVILSSLKFLTDLVIQSVPTSLLKLG